MTTRKPEKHILIVSNSTDELRAVQELMTTDLGGYWSADNEAAGLQRFEEHHPSVLILSFEEIEKAERFYLMLYRQCQKIKEIPHQTLLLCKNTEAESAYALCQSGTVDDYVVNRPLYDPFRLRLSVRHALERRVVGQRCAAQNRQLANVGGDLQHLDHYVGKKLTSGEAQQHESLRAFQHFTAKLNSQLDHFEENLCAPAPGSVVKVLDQDGLRRQFDQFRQQSLELEGGKVEGKLRGASEWLKDFGTGYRQCVEPLRQADLPSPLPEVMVVDDDDLYREMLTVVIEGSGMRVTAVEDGKTALAKLHYRRPNAVLMDYQMPGLDGLTTLRHMKADPDLKSVPVVMLTGDNERTVVEQCIRAGAAGFVIKPSDRSTILDKINSLLAAKV